MVANSALVFELPQDIPELAANAIRRAEYRLNSGDKSEQLQRCSGSERYERHQRQPAEWVQRQRKPFRFWLAQRCDRVIQPQ